MIYNLISVRAMLLQHQIGFIHGLITVILPQVRSDAPWDAIFAEVHEAIPILRDMVEQTPELRVVAA